MTMSNIPSGALSALQAAQTRIAELPNAPAGAVSALQNAQNLVANLPAGGTVTTTRPQTSGGFQAPPIARGGPGQGPNRYMDLARAFIAGRPQQVAAAQGGGWPRGVGIGNMGGLVRTPAGTALMDRIRAMMARQGNPNANGYAEVSGAAAPSAPYYTNLATQMGAQTYNNPQTLGQLSQIAAGGYLPPQYQGQTRPATDIYDASRLAARGYLPGSIGGNPPR